MFTCANGHDKHGCGTHHKGLATARRCRARKRHNAGRPAWDGWRVHRVQCASLIWGTAYLCDCPGVGDGVQLTPAAVERHETYTAPAHSAEGQTCAQCDSPAWHVQGVPFCRDHDQETLKETA